MLFLITYFIFTLSIVLYTYRISYKSDDVVYYHKIHSYLTSLMYYHMFVISIVLMYAPKFTNNIHISILNTLLSIMFSTLFYMTKKENYVIRHIYTFCYVTLASVLMTEIIIYFSGNENDVNKFLILYMIYFFNILYFDKFVNRKRFFFLLLSLISILYVLITSAVLPNENYGFQLLSAVYGLVILGYMFYDHNYLQNVKEESLLNDALKYFFDVEGMIVRIITEYFNK